MTVARGMDVSRYQTVAYETAAKHVEFAIALCSEGQNTVSSAWAKHWKGLGTAKLLRGSYHIAHPEQGHSAKSEADHYVATLKAAGWRSKYDLPPVLDVEPGSVPPRASLSKAAITSWAGAFMARVDEELKLTDPWLRCGLYVGDSITSKVDVAALIAGRWFWRGGYGSTWLAAVPTGCSIYQRVSSPPAVAGVTGGSLDIDIARPEDLRRMAPAHYATPDKPVDVATKPPQKEPAVSSVWDEKLNPGPTADAIGGYEPDKAWAARDFLTGADAKLRQLVADERARYDDLLANVQDAKGLLRDVRTAQDAIQAQLASIAETLKGDTRES